MGDAIAPTTGPKPRYVRPDVDRADAVSVEAEPTSWTDIDTAVRLVSMPAAGTLLRRIGFVLELNLHSQPFCLVGDHPANLARNHLVDALVGRRAIVHLLPQIPHIADDDRLHPACMEGGDQGGRLLCRISRIWRFSF